jgi:alcohol dehydrogenase class IV
MNLENSDWSFPTRIWFGMGRIRELPEACRQLGVSNPLFVTDEGLAPLALVSDTLSLLEADGLSPGLYGDVQGNPTGGNVERGLALYREGNHDGVIVFGGGSAMDAGKCIALLAGHDRPLCDFEAGADGWQLIGPEEVAPIIAVPTTAGTGSEVGRAAVILDEQQHSKKVIFHPSILPGIVISDPALTVGLPPTITAWTGMDAMVHSMEALLAPGFHPMADGIAIEAIRRINQWLPIAVEDGGNLEARGNMLVAASMGATAFQKGLGSVHSVSHVLGALHNTHHGLANAIILPYGLSQNSPAIAQRAAHLCTVLEIPEPGTQALVDHIVTLRQRLDIPNSLAEIDITDDRAADVGELAFADPCTATNAMPVEAADLERLFRAAVCGDYSSLQEE